MMVMNMMVMMMMIMVMMRRRRMVMMRRMMKGWWECYWWQNYILFGSGFCGRNPSTKQGIELEDHSGSLQIVRFDEKMLCKAAHSLYGHHHSLCWLSLPGSARVSWRLLCHQAHPLNREVLTQLGLDTVLPMFWVQKSLHVPHFVFVEKFFSLLSLPKSRLKQLMIRTIESLES